MSENNMFRVALILWEKTCPCSANPTENYRTSANINSRTEIVSNLNLNTYSDNWSGWQSIQNLSKGK